MCSVQRTKKLEEMSEVLYNNVLENIMVIFLWTLVGCSFFKDDLLIVHIKYTVKLLEFLSVKLSNAILHLLKGYLKEIKK